MLRFCGRPAFPRYLAPSVGSPLSVLFVSSPQVVLPLLFDLDIIFTSGTEIADLFLQELCIRSHISTTAKLCTITPSPNSTPRDYNDACRGSHHPPHIHRTVPLAPGPCQLCFADVGGYDIVDILYRHFTSRLLQHSVSKHAMAIYARLYRCRHATPGFFLELHPV